MVADFRMGALAVAAPAAAEPAEEDNNIFYFFICTSQELDPRKLAANDQRLKPMTGEGACISLIIIIITTLFFNTFFSGPLSPALRGHPDGKRAFHLLCACFTSSGNADNDSQLQSEFIKFMDFETEYVCRLYAPKLNVLERSWSDLSGVFALRRRVSHLRCAIRRLTLRKSLRQQNVTKYDYCVLFPLKVRDNQGEKGASHIRCAQLNMGIHLRSWQADICSWLVKRSIKGDR